MRTLATVAECEQSRDRLAELSERIADLLAETPTQRVQIARDLGRADPRVRQRLTALAELERSLEELGVEAVSVASSFSTSSDLNRRLETTRSVSARSWLARSRFRSWPGQHLAQIEAEIVASSGLEQKSRSAA